MASFQSEATYAYGAQKNLCRRRKNTISWITSQVSHHNKLCTSSKGRCRLGSKKGKFSSKNQRLLWLFAPNCEFPHRFPLLFSFSAPHSNTQHISHIQQEQTSHQAQQLHCLKSTEHEGLNKKSVSISVPADREDKGQDWRCYFKQKVDSNYPCILLSAQWILLNLQHSKARTKQHARPLYEQRKNCSTEAECPGSCAGCGAIVHEYVSTYIFRQVKSHGGKGSCLGGFNQKAEMSSFVRSFVSVIKEEQRLLHKEPVMPVTHSDTCPTAVVQNTTLFAKLREYEISMFFF